MSDSLEVFWQVSAKFETDPQCDKWIISLSISDGDMNCDHKDIGQMNLPFIQPQFNHYVH